MKQAAVMLDRDGILVHPSHYPSHPESLRLYDGIGPALRDLQQAGFKLVVITNQAGIARGYFTEDDLRVMHDHLKTQLARDGVQLDGIYYEAMTIGMPVVALATTELPTVIENGRSGFVSCNISKLVVYMRRLLADRHEARWLGENARAVALARFGLPRFMNDWNRAFALVTRRQPASHLTA